MLYTECNNTIRQCNNVINIWVIELDQFFKIIFESI